MAVCVVMVLVASLETKGYYGLHAHGVCQSYMENNGGQLDHPYTG